MMAPARIPIFALSSRRYGVIAYTAWFITLVAIFFFVRSFFVQDRLEGRHIFVSAEGSACQEWNISSSRGGVSLGRRWWAYDEDATAAERIHTSEPSGIQWSTYLPANYPQGAHKRPQGLSGQLGFQFENSTERQEFWGYLNATVRSGWWYLVIPHAIWLAPLGLVSVWLMLRQYRTASRAKRARNGLCAACGYDVRTTTTGRCPECGTDVFPRDQGTAS